MNKKNKINLGKRQLSPEEITLIEQGLRQRKENFLGRPTIIEGGKCGDELRILKIGYSNFGMPTPIEDLYIYNLKGKFVKKRHISRYY